VKLAQYEFDRWFGSKDAASGCRWNHRLKPLIRLTGGAPTLGAPGGLSYWP